MTRVRKRIRYQSKSRFPDSQTRRQPGKLPVSRCLPFQLTPFPGFHVTHLSKGNLLCRLQIFGLGVVSVFGYTPKNYVLHRWFRDLRTHFLLSILIVYVRKIRGITRQKQNKNYIRTYVSTQALILPVSLFLSCPANRSECHNVTTYPSPHPGCSENIFA